MELKGFLNVGFIWTLLEWLSRLWSTAENVDQHHPTYFPATKAPWQSVQQANIPTIIIATPPATFLCVLLSSFWLGRLGRRPGRCVSHYCCEAHSRSSVHTERGVIVVGFRFFSILYPFSLLSTPVLSACPLHTNSGCGKERRILIGPW